MTKSYLLLHHLHGHDVSKKREVISLSFTPLNTSSKSKIFFVPSHVPDVVSLCSGADFL